MVFKKHNPWVCLKSKVLIYARVFLCQYINAKRLLAVETRYTPPKEKGMSSSADEGKIVCNSEAIDFYSLSIGTFF